MPLFALSLGGRVGDGNQRLDWLLRKAKPYPPLFYPFPPSSVTLVSGRRFSS